MARETLRDLDTPVPLIEVGRLEVNLAGMADRLRAAGVAHRPNVKTHKTAAIARRQVELGARGLTVAKLGEAEAMADAGFDDLFVAYPIVGETKLRRLAALAERAAMRFEVDSVAVAEAASAYLSRHGPPVEVVVSIDGGAGRSGAATPDAAIAVAERVAELPGLRLVGVMNYGNAYGTADPADQAEIGRVEGADAAALAAAFRRRGLPADVVTVGSTPTARSAAGVPGVTEVRAGVYALLDRKQLSLGVAAPDACALTVLATVVSRPTPTRYVVDAGLKALAGEDYGWRTWGQLLDRPDLAITRATEEHGIIDLPADAPRPGWSIGDRVRIVPNHACGTVNMHDELVAVDGELVVDRWPVVARGRVR